MTKRKKITELFAKISRKRPKDKDIKKFSSEFIELMAKSGIPPKTRQEFYLYTQKPSPDLDKIIKFAENTMGLVLEKI